MTVKEQEREYVNLYSEIIDSLEEAYTNEEISEDELVDLKTQTLAELEIALAELRGLTKDNLDDFTEDNTEEEQNYSMNNNYANFSTASAYLVPAVMELIDSHYEDRDEAFSDIMEATEIDEEELEGFLTGNLEASPEFIDILNGMFEETATDPEAALGLQLMGALDRGDTTEEELEEAEYEEEEDDEEELEEEEEDEPEANYSAVDPRIQELEFKMADIERTNALKQKLNSIAEFAKEGLEERWLSRAMYDLLLGSFDKDEDRVAAFSQTANANKVDLATQLYAVLFALKANEECGEKINFSTYVSEPLTPALSEEEDLAKLQIDKMIENRLLFNKH